MWHVAHVELRKDLLDRFMCTVGVSGIFFSVCVCVQRVQRGTHMTKVALTSRQVSDTYLSAPSPPPGWRWAAEVEAPHSVTRTTKVQNLLPPTTPLVHTAFLNLLVNMALLLHRKDPMAHRQPKIGPR